MSVLAALSPTSQLLPSLSNFRDLGGKGACGGRITRSGLLYRTARPTAVSDADIARLEGFGISAIVDLRGEEEAATAPAQLSPPLMRLRRALSIEPVAGPRIRAAQAEGPLTAAIVRDIMMEGYRSYVTRHARTYASLLRLVGEAEGAVVFHCSAGKDRTGFGAALILSVLGVGWDEVAADFLRTNTDWVPPADLATEAPADLRRAWLGVEIGYLEAAFAALEAEHGGAEAFAVAALGGEQELSALRAKYTE